MIRDGAPNDVLFEASRRERPHPDAITVAISLYNYERFVTECLASVAAQTHGPVELVVVDDASDDGSAPAAMGWMQANAGRFVRATLLRHTSNQGLATTRNSAFARATAHHVMVLDADNMLFSRALARLLECKLDAGVSVAYSQTAMFGDSEEPGYADVWTPERFERANFVDAMALVSRNAWAQVGGYRHLQHGWEDFDFWCRFVEAGFEGVFIPEMLCRYRVHRSSMLRTRTDPGRGGVISQLSYLHPWLDLQD